MSNFKDKKVLVLGLGKSGREAALYLSEAGAAVFVSDKSENPETIKAAVMLNKMGIIVTLGSQNINLLDNKDFVVVSPGISNQSKILIEAKKRGIKVWGELELAFRETNLPIVAVTGTNGKTTTTTIIGDIFKAAGIMAPIVGNIGTPLISAVKDNKNKALIVEVSSFQLDSIETFKPKISILLNITPDHLDWHADFDDYVKAKSKIFLNQEPEDFAIVNIDDEVSGGLIPQIKAKVIKTSKRPLNKGVYIKDGKIYAKINKSGEILVVDLNDLKIKGAHNADNVMAAIGTSLIFGISVGVIRLALKDFKGLSHRIEFVEEIKGVTYFDDSKATNVDATIKAVQSFSEPIVLMVGGKNKGNSFFPLAEGLLKNVKAVIGFGEAGPEILKTISTDVKTMYVEKVPDAVLKASQIATSGEVVLFSPACASFDAFKNYSQRGDVFKKAVISLKK